MNKSKTKKINYSAKFTSFTANTLFEKLPVEEQQFIRQISFQFRFTFQEFRQVVEFARDLEMWREQPLSKWFQTTTVINKQDLIKQIRNYISQFKKNKNVYNHSDNISLMPRNTKKVVLREATENIYGMCPVASPKTICCNLRTIDAVENCVFGCSYCTIQTFYTQDIKINRNIEQRLENIPIDVDRFYHFGTGQSSDSLAYGNREGILDAHCRFAEQHPNILLEFKTKSKNIDYFLTNEIPLNVVCSWSLNTPAIIKNEEHFTATLAERIESARIVADAGIKVAFHFHPMVYYTGWEQEYESVAKTIQTTFDPQEILFVSFGSVTLIKPVIQKIRDLGNPSKILQMEFVTDPHGKYTYPDAIKVKMFRHIYTTFRAWQEKVFFYLCMEKVEIWLKSFGYVYRSNEEFEKTFGEETMRKIRQPEPKVV